VSLPYHEPLAALPDGSFLVSRHDEFEFTEPRVYEIRNHATIYVLRPDGDTTSVVARYLSYERTYRPRGRGHQMALQLFQPLRYAAGTSSGFVWCDASSFHCDVWSGEGRRTRSLRVNASARPVTDADVDRYRAGRAAGMGPNARAIAQLDSQIALADRGATLPFYSHYRVDGADRLWFREYSVDEAPGPTRWLVFSAAGELLGSVVMPRIERLFSIGDGVILALERGKDDEQILAVYRYVVTR
jgi:hypothetical protein